MNISNNLKISFKYPTKIASNFFQEKTMSKVILLFLLYSGVCAAARTHKAVIDVVPASAGSTASLQCYTYEAYCFPWPHRNENWRNSSCKSVWMKDGKVLEPHGRINVTSSVTYNFCDTFTNTAQQYTSASGLELPKTGVIKNYNVYEGFGCFVSTLTIANVEASDFGVYQCNYSDHRPDVQLYQQFHYLANVTLVETENYAPEPKVDLVFQHFIPDTNEKEKLAQCISVGTSLDWYYTDISKNLNGCDKFPSRSEYDNCLYKKYSVSISNLATHDLWRCFEVTNVTQEAFGYKVFQSFLSLKNLCHLDEFYFYCGLADKSIGENVGKFDVKTSNPRYYSFDFEFGLSWAGVATGIVVGALLVGASVLACSRITCVRSS